MALFHLAFVLLLCLFLALRFEVEVEVEVATSQPYPSLLLVILAMLDAAFTPFSLPRRLLQSLAYFRPCANLDALYPRSGFRILGSRNGARGARQH